MAPDSALPVVVENSDGSLGIVEMSGEIVTMREASDEALGRWFAAYKRAQDLLRSAKRDLDAELVRRADYNATSHVDIPGVGRVTVTGPKDEEVWDVEKLRDVLRGLVAGGLISDSAAYSALERVVAWKPKVSGLNALRKLGGEIEARINACCDHQPPVRRATLREVRPVSSSARTPDE